MQSASLDPISLMWAQDLPASLSLSSSEIAES